MTPTEAREFMAGTFGPARARSVITKLANQVEALTGERDELRLQIDVQASSIEAVQAANQRLAASHKECVRCLGEALQDRANLAAAGKLALETLDRAADAGYSIECEEAQNALRQAGVQ